MPLKILDRVIERVEVIDDDPNVREEYSYSIEDMELTPIVADGSQKFTEVTKLVAIVREQSDAAICDYNLMTKNFANFYGSEAVANLYSKNFPAILCTRYGKSEADNIRTFKAQIPVLLTPDELAEPENIEAGFRQCIEEFNGQYRASRRSHRTLVCIDDYKPERKSVYVIVPAWDPTEVIGLREDGIPPQILERIKMSHPCFHAQVNLGAETYQDIYFTNWENS